VALVTSGPAATNLVTPLCDAYMDSIPMVAITGQVPTGAIGTDAFQECDTVGITRSVTKHNELVMSPQDLPRAIKEAFQHRHHRPPRPGAGRRAEGRPHRDDGREWPESLDLPGYKPNMAGNPKMIKEAARYILAAHQPILYVGGGILKARAADTLKELAELTDIRVVTTLMARGAFPDDHPLCLGMPGMHGNYTAITAMQKSDLLIALGSRFERPHHRPSRRLRPGRQDHSTSTSTGEIGKVRRRRADVATAASSSGAGQGDQDLLNGGESAPTAPRGSSRRCRAGRSATRWRTTPQADGDALADPAGSMSTWMILASWAKPSRRP